MTEAEKTTIFIIDDDTSVRKAVSFLLNSEGYETECYDSAESFLKRRRYPGMGCVILDIKMKEISGLELQEELIKKHFNLPIIFITGHGDIPTSVKVIKKGAFEFLTKPFMDDDLLNAVSNAVKFNKENRELNSEKEKIFDELITLTERENDILKYIIGGFMNKEISLKLGIAEQTVKIHRGHIMNKLKVYSVADLVRKAEKAGITPEKHQI